MSAIPAHPPKADCQHSPTLLPFRVGNADPEGIAKKMVAPRPKNARQNPPFIQVRINGTGFDSRSNIPDRPTRLFPHYFAYLRTPHQFKGFGLL
jgi:hypothetical protein